MIGSRTSYDLPMPTLFNGVVAGHDDTTDSGSGMKRGPTMSVRVSVILSRKGSDVVTIARDAMVTEALQVLAEHNVGALIVSADGTVVDGIVSERDIVRWLAREGPEALEYPVEQVMTSEVLTCASDATADDVMQTMTTHRARHLPVLDDDGRLAGIVSIGDVVKSRIDDLVTQARSMEDYISGRPL